MTVFVVAILLTERLIFKKDVFVIPSSVFSIQCFQIFLVAS